GGDEGTRVDLTNSAAGTTRFGENARRDLLGRAREKNGGSRMSRRLLALLVGASLLGAAWAAFGDGASGRQGRVPARAKRGEGAATKQVSPFRTPLRTPSPQ